MCDEYGIELTDDHLKEVRSIANDNGEVSNFLTDSMKKEYKENI